MSRTLYKYVGIGIEYQCEVDQGNTLYITVLANNNILLDIGSSFILYFQKHGYHHGVTYQHRCNIFEDYRDYNEYHSKITRYYTLLLVKYIFRMP